MKKTGIYKITSPTEKIYVGQSVDIKHRWNQYKYLYKKGIGPKLYNSLKKHNWENHKFEILEECNQEQLHEKELFWKQTVLEELDNNWEQVLFCGLYDIGGGPKSEETKQKMRKPKPVGFGINHSIKMKGKKRNLSWIENLVKSKQKPILQYDLEGNFIKEWESGKIVTNILKIDNGRISRCCKNKVKSAGGYIWKYKNNIQ